MKISKTRITLAGMAGAGALLAAVVAGGPAAFAQSGCSGPSCGESSNVQVTSSITLTLAAPISAPGNSNTTAGSITLGGGPVTAGQTVGPQVVNNGSGQCGWGAAGAGATFCADQMVEVTSQDTSGYTITAGGPAYTASGTSTTIPITDQSMALGMSAPAGTYHGTTLSGAGASVASSATTSASGGTLPDAWYQTDQLAVPAGIGTGSFSTTITLTAVAS